MSVKHIQYALLFTLACVLSSCGLFGINDGDAGGMLTGPVVNTPGGGFDDPLEILAVNPSLGPPGSVIEISGTGLAGNAPTEVRFGEVPAFVLSAAANLVVVRAPVLLNGLLGLVPITVTVGDQSFTNNAAFTYTESFNCDGLPTILSVSPAAATNNNSVSIIGNGFLANETEVSLGGAMADAAVQSPTLLTMSIPNLDGVCDDNCELDIIVQNSNGCQFVLEEGFTYRKDTDGDTIFDDDEGPQCGTNPNEADHDGDGLRDDKECFEYDDCDPLNPDSDGNGLNDGEEFEDFGKCTNNVNFDSDGDTYQNASGPLCIADPAQCDCNDNDPNIHPGVENDPLDGVDRNCRLDFPTCADAAQTLTPAGQEEFFVCNQHGDGGTFGTYAAAFPTFSYNVTQMAPYQQNGLCVRVKSNYDANDNWWADDATYRIETLRVLDEDYDLFHVTPSQCDPPHYSSGEGTPCVGRMFSYELQENGTCSINNFFYGSWSPQVPGCGTMHIGSNTTVKSPWITYGNTAYMKSGDNYCNFVEDVNGFQYDNFVRVVNTGEGDNLKMRLEVSLTTFYWANAHPSDIACYPTFPGGDMWIGPSGVGGLLSCEFGD